MRRITLLLVLILSCTSLQAQEKVPAALEQRLIAFTEQLWASWMKSGDIRSVASMRIPEVVNDPPCGATLFATIEKICDDATKEERADFRQTADNVIALMMYRVLSRQTILDLIASMDKADPDSFLDQMFKVASFSDAESSLFKDLEGGPRDIDEFRRWLSGYKELEKMLQADHLKDFTRNENQAKYEQNIALLDQGLRSTLGISKVNDPDAADGMPPGGDYYVIPKGMFGFVVRVNGDLMQLAFPKEITK
jgi:hypothetical protein